MTTTMQQIMMNKSQKQGLLACVLIVLLLAGLKIFTSTTDPQQNYDEGNFKKAAKLYLPLAENGDANAQYYLGVMHSNGQGVSQDYIEAVKWYKLAAEQGSVNAQNNLGHMYGDGKIVPKDLKAALYWFNKAAQAGQPNAQTSLGWSYMSNYLELAPDYRLAMAWNLKAAKQGFSEGSANIGLLYENGWGVNVNFVEAARWYKKAIHQGAGSGQAERQLNKLYEKGLGFKKYLNEA